MLFGRSRKGLNPSEQWMCWRKLAATVWRFSTWLLANIQIFSKLKTKTHAILILKFILQYFGGESWASGFFFFCVWAALGYCCRTKHSLLRWFEHFRCLVAGNQISWIPIRPWMKGKKLHRKGHKLIRWCQISELSSTSKMISSI